MNKWLFQTGAPANTKLMECPGCHEEACHWIGGSPKDIECLNDSCEFFKMPPGCKKKEEKKTDGIADEWTFMMCSYDGKPNKNNDVFEDIHFYNAPEGTKIKFDENDCFPGILDYASTPDKVPEIKIKFDFFEHPLIWRF